MDSHRILITGLSSHLGGRLARELEPLRGIEAIIGVDTSDPRHELQRTEFVRVDTEYRLLRRIVHAAAIDTVIDTRLIADPLLAAPSRIHAVNVLGTASVVMACSDDRSPVRKLVFKSSANYYGSERNDPAFFTEEMVPSRPPSSSIQRGIAQAEAAVAELGAHGPAATVTVLRVADAIGGELRGSHLALLTLPAVPSMLGFDPRCQLIHEDDVVGAIVHAVTNDLPGIYNVAADGVLALSEIASLLGKPMLPVLPPWGAVLIAGSLRRLGLRIPLELIAQLRFGRGLDNRRLKAAGYHYRYTTREAALKLRAQQRLRPLLGTGDGSYRYERELEEFLRWSPAVQSAPSQVDGARSGRANGPPVDAYDALSAGELIELISSLEPGALTRLRQYEASNLARERVLEALDMHLERRSGRAADEGRGAR